MNTIKSIPYPKNNVDAFGDLIKNTYCHSKQNQPLNNCILQSLLIIDAIRSKFSDNSIGIMWSGGKDSTALLHMLRFLYFRKNVPFIIIYLDTLLEHDEIKSYIDKIKKEWKLKIDVFTLDKIDVRALLKIKDQNKKRLHLSLLIQTRTKEIINKLQIRCLLYGGKGDEYLPVSNYIGKIENVSLCYPLISFNKTTIWEYIHHFSIPYVKLYDKGYSHIETTLFKPIIT